MRVKTSINPNAPKGEVRLRSGATATAAVRGTIFTKSKISTTGTSGAGPASPGSYEDQTIVLTVQRNDPANTRIQKMRAREWLRRKFWKERNAAAGRRPTWR